LFGAPTAKAEATTADKEEKLVAAETNPTDAKGTVVVLCQ